MAEATCAKTQSNTDATFNEGKTLPFVASAFDLLPRTKTEIISIFFLDLSFISKFFAQ